MVRWVDRRESEEGNGSGRFVKLFSPRAEKLLSNIQGNIWKQTTCARRAECLYGGFRKMFNRGGAEEGRRRIESMRE